VAKGELTILRCRAIAAELKELMAKDAQVEVIADPQENTITLQQRNGPTLVLRPISISPVV